MSWMMALSNIKGNGLYAHIYVVTNVQTKKMYDRKAFELESY